VKNRELAGERAGDDIGRERGHEGGAEDRRSEMPLDFFEDKGQPCQGSVEGRREASACARCN